ncbi:hypothetical protein RHGRI_018003 [Rhododendron griersonianum]|nr:hypothetical protein RHGRI_018003 [Rhododendron griersonianum]
MTEVEPPSRLFSINSFTAETGAGSLLRRRSGSPRIRPLQASLSPLFDSTPSSPSPFSWASPSLPGPAQPREPPPATLASPPPNTMSSSKWSPSASSSSPPCWPRASNWPST